MTKLYAFFSTMQGFGGYDSMVDMNIILKGLVLVGVAIVSIGGGTALAQTASTPLSATHTLLTYEFSENFLNRDVVVPLMATTSRASHRPLSAGYEIEGLADGTLVGAHAAVLSSLSLTHGGYEALAGSKNTYLLVVLVEHTTDTRPTALSLTALPFLTLTDDAIDGQSVKNY